MFICIFLIITTCEDQRISKEKQIDDMTPLLARLIFSCEEIQDRLGIFFFQILTLIYLSVK